MNQFSISLRSLQIGSLFLAILLFLLPWSFYGIFIGLAIILSFLQRQENFTQSFSSDRVLNHFLLVCMAYVGLTALYIFADDGFNLSSLKYLERYTALIALPVAFIRIKPNTSERKDLLMAMVYGVLIVIVICLSYAVYRNFYHSWNPFTLSNSFHQYYRDDWIAKWIFVDFFLHQEFSGILRLHPTYLGLYVIMAAQILLQFLVEVKSIRIKLNLAFAIVFLSIIQILLLSRIGIILHFTSIIVFILVHQKNKLLTSVAIVILVVGALVSSSMVRQRVVNQLTDVKNYILIPSDNLISPDKLNGINLRILNWHIAYQAIDANPMIGSGPQHIEAKLSKTATALNYPILFVNSHNQYLDEWLGKGLPGLLMLLIFFFLIFKVGIRQKNYLLLLFAVIFMANCCIESMFSREKGILALAFFCCMFMGDPNQNISKA